MKYRLRTTAYYPVTFGYVGQMLPHKMCKEIIDLGFGDTQGMGQDPAPRGTGRPWSNL